jgi:hypothetical protein
MTTEGPVTELTGTTGLEVAPEPPSAPGDRLQRLHRRQRLVREEMAAALFLFALLAVTVAVLAAQWLSSSPITFGGAS